LENYEEQSSNPISKTERKFVEMITIKSATGVAASNTGLTKPLTKLYEQLSHVFRDSDFRLVTGKDQEIDVFNDRGNLVAAFSHDGDSFVFNYNGKVKRSPSIHALPEYALEQLTKASIRSSAKGRLPTSEIAQLIQKIWKKEGIDSEDRNFEGFEPSEITEAYEEYVKDIRKMGFDVTLREVKRAYKVAMENEPEPEVLSAQC
jgi:hypothetical protein